MEISYNWLRQYVPLDCDAETVGQILTSIGLEVESLTPRGAVPGELKGLIVGEVQACERIPNTDHLHVTMVNVGKGSPLRIVCGAPNVRERLKVVVAPVGVTLYNHQGAPLVIKRAKIRGVESEGMLCAEDEIGVGTSHEGIIELDDRAKVGSPVALQYPALCDYIFSIGVTANRADALSHYGVARDLAAYFNQKVPTKAILPEISIQLGAKSATQVELGEIDTAGCVRYSGLTIRGVEVKASPEWVAERLRSVGLTPICNVVDVTNLVMLELGQPLHAFDLGAFPTRRVSVGFPPAGTPLETLDGQVRTFGGEDLAVCHGSTPVCIAGIFGGKASGIAARTTEIFLESAVFNPVMVRKSSRRFALQTDASYRFERGVDPAFTVVALKRAASLIMEIAGGRIDGDIIDFYPRPLEHEPIVFDSQRAYSLMGVTLSRRELETLFDGLEIDYRPIGAGKYELKVPYYRVDVTRMEDVTEDILRLYGYDRVPVSSKMSIALDQEMRPAVTMYEKAVRLMLVGAGFSEIMCNSLTSSKNFGEEVSYEGFPLVRILNPRSMDFDALRPTLLLGGLEAIARNTSHQRSSLQLCEFGHCYHSSLPKTLSGDDPLDAYVEQSRLGLWLTGYRREDSWNEGREPYDIYHLKGYCEAILSEAGVELRDARYERSTLAFLSNAATISLVGREGWLCRFGEVDEGLLKSFSIKQPVFYAEMSWEVLLSIWEAKKVRNVELPQFPEVRRDLALILPESVTFGQVEEVALRVAGGMLKRMSLFDVYEGNNIPKGMRSYAVKFILQDEHSTLDDIAIEQCMQRLITALTESLGATLRG